jgi:3-hydroxyisobutyrate dehydrogenase-like beta-hydroxyacid dehydrogenase
MNEASSENPKVEPVSPSNTVVGMVGIGDMGAGIAASILRRFSLVAFDSRPEAIKKIVAAGARGASSLQDLADQCEVVIVVVLNDPQVIQVVGEILRHPGKLHTIIVCSTILPNTATTLSEQARKAGISLIDAPVSGGAEKSSRGTITVLIGGEPSVVQRCWPIFEAFGKSLFHIGPIGAGSAGKLVNNLLSLGGNILILEAMQLANACGISEEAVTEFVSVGTGDSRGIRTWGRLDRVRRTTHTLAGTAAVYEAFSKDVKAAAVAAGQHGIVLPITACIGAMTSEKLKARDQLLTSRGKTDPIPRCTVCDHELASPYRKAGVHPECAPDQPGQSVR